MTHVSDGVVRSLIEFIIDRQMLGTKKLLHIIARQATSELSVLVGSLELSNKRIDVRKAEALLVILAWGHISVLARATW